MLYARRTLIESGERSKRSKDARRKPRGSDSAKEAHGGAGLQMTSGSDPADAGRGTVESFLGDRQGKARNAQSVLHLVECVGTSKVPRIGTRVPWIAARTSGG